MTNALTQHNGTDWKLINGDCVEVLAALPDNSIHYSIFSPPFSSLYTFSDSPRDLSNCKNYDEFVTHYRFLAQQQFRTLKPGRLLSFHCMNLTTTKSRDGYIGIKDLRGDLIRVYQSVGFVLHSEVVIRKDPKVAAQRTKSHSLVHGHVIKDRCRGRQALADYVITMGKPGYNEEPVKGPFTEFYGDDAPLSDNYDHGEADGFVLKEKPNWSSIGIWERYADPVWVDINPSDTLQYRNAKDNNDERHISLLQLDVIRRCLQTWTNPGDVVLDPFNGVGSTGHVALEMGRKYIGVELKESYYNCAVTNLTNAEDNKQGQLTLI